MDDRPLNTQQPDTRPPGLKQRAVRSVGWVFVLRGVQLFCHLAKLVLLARLLTPTDFGLFGIALLAFSVLDVFSEPGFQPALIQKRGEIRSYLDTAWTLGLLRGVFITGVLWIAAPAIAACFGTPAAIPVIRAIGCVSVLRSVTNVSVLYFEKELQFSKYFWYQFPGVLLDFAVAVAIAWHQPTVWALVIGFLAGAALRTLLSYVVQPYRPRFEFNRTRARELWAYGKWLLSSNILLFLLTQGDDVLVGTMLGASALGLYQLAYRISNIPQSEYTHLISRVAFPTYSRLQHDMPRLGNAYARILCLTTLISLPTAAAISLFAYDFTRLFLGPQWLPMVPALQILGCFGCLRALAGTTTALFAAIDRLRVLAKLQAAQLLLFLLLIYPLAVRFDITGAALAVTAAALLVSPACIFYALRLTHAPRQQLYAALTFSAAATFLISALVVVLRSSLLPADHISSFLILAALAVVLYTGGAYLFRETLGYPSLAHVTRLLVGVIRPVRVQQEESQ